MISNACQRQNVQEYGIPKRANEDKAVLGKAAVQRYIGSMSGSLAQRLSGGAAMESVNHQQLASDAIGKFDQIWKKHK